LSQVYWYACVYEGEKRIIYGRAPAGESEGVVDHIKESLRFHNLIGLHSKIFLRSSRFVDDGVVEYCEKKMDRNQGDFRSFATTKLDLR